MQAVCALSYLFSFGFGFVKLMIDFIHTFWGRFTGAQSYDCPAANEVTLTKTSDKITLVHITATKQSLQIPVCIL